MVLGRYLLIEGLVGDHPPGSRSVADSINCVSVKQDPY